MATTGVPTSSFATAAAASVTVTFPISDTEPGAPTGVSAVPATPSDGLLDGPGVQRRLGHHRYR